MNIHGAAREGGMLVLTRKLGEGITIGSGIRIVILGIRGSQVRLGIDAPPNTAIYRDEVYKKIVEENRRAAEGACVEVDVAGLIGHDHRAKQRSRL